MLVLARKESESIVIDNNVEIVVLEIRGDQVRIGIKAPPSVKIYRSEVWETIKKENISSTTVSDDKLEAMSKILKQTEKTRE